MDCRHYKPTTRRRRSCGLVKPDVITVVHIWYRARRRSSRWSGEEGGPTCERIGGSPSPGSWDVHATAYFRGNKDRRNVLTDMLFPMRSGVAVWHPDIDLWNRYIVYRISFNITTLFGFWTSTIVPRRCQIKPRWHICCLFKNICTNTLL